MIFNWGKKKTSGDQAAAPGAPAEEKKGFLSGLFGRKGAVDDEARAKPDTDETAPEHAETANAEQPDQSRDEDAARRDPVPDYASPDDATPQPAAPAQPELPTPAVSDPAVDHAPEPPQNGDQNPDLNADLNPEIRADIGSGLPPVETGAERASEEDLTALTSPPALDKAEVDAEAEAASGRTQPEPPVDTAGPALQTTEEQGAGSAQTARRDGFFAKLSKGLARSSSRLGENVAALFTKRKLDRAALDELEELLIMSDLGTVVAGRVVERLADARFDKEVSDHEIREALADTIAETLRPLERDIDLSGPAPQVVMFVGVNGSGKTTTLGKIAALISREGRKVVMAAGDTFRAAAVEQLQVWGERAGTTVIARPQGADAAGLVYDAHEEAAAMGADVLLIDTAGRLQNKAHLMEELRKIVRVLKKRDETAPHHVLLVLDGTVGQNALSQVKTFREVADVTGLIVTKLDSTAKGGVLVAIAASHPDLPIYFTGVGESLDDLAPFNAEHFARALTGAAIPEGT